MNPSFFLTVQTVDGLYNVHVDGCFVYETDNVVRFLIK